MSLTTFYSFSFSTILGGTGEGEGESVYTFLSVLSSEGSLDPVALSPVALSASLVTLVRSVQDLHRQSSLSLLHFL